MIFISIEKNRIYIIKKMPNIKNDIKNKIIDQIKKWKYTIKKKELNNSTYLDRKSDLKLGIG